jgi:hypothetical protein
MNIQLMIDGKVVVTQNHIVNKRERSILIGWFDRQIREAFDREKLKPKLRKFKEGELYKVKYRGDWTIFEFMGYDEFKYGGWRSSEYGIFGNMEECANWKIGKRIKFKD